MSDLTKVVPPQELTEDDRKSIFDHIFRRLAVHRNTIELYASNEHDQAADSGLNNAKQKILFMKEIDHWAQELLHHAWLACKEPHGGECPELDPLTDTSIRDLPKLPSAELLGPLINAVLFLSITHGKVYSAHTRTFLIMFAPLNEHDVVSVLKNPDHAVQEAEKKTEAAKQDQAEKSKIFRKAAIGLGAVAGGVLIGVTGGLAAPLVGGVVTSVLGWVGVGGTAAGMLASGLVSSSVVCGTLFGIYGANRSSKIIEHHVREVRDFAVTPVRPPNDTLAVRLCVSGWLSSKNDVTAPWTVFEGDDTYALQWEIEALEALSAALQTLIKAQAIKYIKKEIISRTVFAALFSALAPAAWLQIGQIIDNPWMNAKSLAVKAGKCLGVCLAEHVLGARPVTLVGYSLGSLVIFEALKHLATLPPSKTAHLVQDVFLFGAPVPADTAQWTAVRRVVAGRLVNGYCEGDYILAVLSRVSDMSWSVAGLTEVPVQGVENVRCEGVEGHLKWRGQIGKCLQQVNAPDVAEKEVEQQLQKVDKKIDKLEKAVGELPDTDDLADAGTILDAGAGGPGP